MKEFTDLSAKIVGDILRIEIPLVEGHNLKLGLSVTHNDEITQDSSAMAWCELEVGRSLKPSIQKPTFHELQVVLSRLKPTKHLVESYTRTFGAVTVEEERNRWWLLPGRDTICFTISFVLVAIFLFAVVWVHECEE